MRSASASKAKISPAPHSPRSDPRKQRDGRGPVAFHRFTVLHNWLSSGRSTTATKLATHLETTARTIKRDIERLRDDYDAPIIWDAKRHTYRYTRADFQLPLIRLNADEAMALALASETFTAWRGTLLGRSLATAFAKVGHTLGDALSLPTDELAHCISTPAQGSDALAEQAHFPIVLEAVLRRQVLRFDYHPPHGRHGPRRVHPLHLTAHEQRWMLIAWDPARRVARRYNLARMTALSPETAIDAFAAPTAFDLSAYLATTFGPHAGAELHHVVLRFDAYAAPYIREHLYHPSQRITPAPDHPGAVEVQVTVNHLLDIQRWVLSWGRHAEALAPPILRRQIATELAALTSTYATELPLPPAP